MLRYTFLVNGAAVISLMTFLGNLQGKSQSLPHLRVAFICFIVGILLSSVASITTYMVQLLLFNESGSLLKVTGFKSHAFWLYTTLTVIFLSIVCFAIGALYAMAQLT